MAKQNLTYNIIIHPIRKKLELSLLQYCVADSIYHLSNNPNSKIKGWCFASKTTIGDLMGVTERCVFDNLKVLIKKKLIEKDEDSKYLRTTSKWYENVVIIKAKKEYEEVAGGMQNLQGGMKKVHRDTEEIAYNSNSYNDNYKKPSKEGGKPSEHGNPDINTLEGFLREKMGLQTLDGTQKSNRRYCWLSLKKFGGLQAVKDIILAGASDEFWRKNLTDFKTLYYKAEKIKKVAEKLTSKTY